MGTTVLVICAGSMDDSSRLMEELKQSPSPTVICADGGARYAKELGIIPDAIIGDMDSIDRETLAFFQGKGSSIVSHPAAKDETDTELALRYTLGLKPDRILLFGSLGTRMDHSLANIFLLASEMTGEADLRIIDDRCEIFAVTGTATVRGEQGQTLSLLPLSPVVSGITLEGFEYPLHDGEIRMGRSLGVSNRLSRTEGSVRVGSGRLLVIINTSTV